MQRNAWTRQEVLIAFNLFCRTPFGRLHARNPEIIQAAARLGRTPDAFAMKCCNLAAFDPALKARGIRGLRSGSKTDRLVWTEFERDPDTIGYESELAWAAVMKRTPRMDVQAVWEVPEGKERRAVAKTRVNQYLFRSIVMAGYHSACAVCDLPIARLLVASHIVGWAIDPANRMNPRNGICLCALHDRAFDCGLLHVDDTCKVFLADSIRRLKGRLAVDQNFLRFDGLSLRLPDRWLPDPVLLKRRLELLNRAG